VHYTVDSLTRLLFFVIHLLAAVVVAIAAAEAEVAMHNDVFQ
jgi:hypothetical protein